jgi:PAS domain-containing protein
MHVRVHVHGEALGDGRFMVHGLSQDITELTEAHEAALRAESQSRRLMEEAPFAVALFDKTLRYAMVSPRWVELFKPADDKILGYRLDELAPGVGLGAVQGDVVGEGRVQRGRERGQYREGQGPDREHPPGTPGAPLAQSRQTSRRGRAGRVSGHGIDPWRGGLMGEVID